MHTPTAGRSSRISDIAALRAARTGQLALGDVDLDTGNRAARGANPLADETYADLLAELAERTFAGVPSALRGDINEYYASRSGPREMSRKARKQERQAARHLQALNASAAPNR